MTSVGRIKTVLAEMTNPEIIEHITKNSAASPCEREMAERLLAACEEIDLLVRELKQCEAPSETGGADGGNS